MVKRRLVKWGNSVCVTIPPVLLEMKGLKVGDYVNVTITRVSGGDKKPKKKR